MVVKILLLILIIIVYLIVWLITGTLLSDHYGAVGMGGSMVVGFIVLPIIVRLYILYAFKPSRKLKG